MSDDDGYDADDGPATAVGVSLFASPEIPHYPAVARFGDLEILGRLARGGMAEVYLARETAEDGSERHLVLKRILPTYAEDEDFRAMFDAEGRMATRLYHPNVCHVYDSGTLEGTPYITLEWVHGTTLKDLLQRAGERALAPVPVALEIIACVADALHYIHHASGLDGKPLGIIHRDVSPHNVMVSWTGEVKLLDFGIAKTTAQAPERGGQKGKHGYMSPEQLRNRPLDTRSDLFALGVCLYETLTGRRLYDRENIPVTFQAIVEEPPPSVREVRPEVDEALDAIVKKALAKDPADRFPTAGALRDALRAHLSTLGAAVYSIDIVAYLNRVFAPDEKAPLPEGSGTVTGSFRPLSEAESERVVATSPAPKTAPPKAAPRRIAPAPPEAAKPPAPKGPALRPPPRPPEVRPATPPSSRRGTIEKVVSVAVILAAAAAAYWLIYGH